MKLKKVLRIVWLTIYWFLFVVLIRSCFLGTNTIFANIALIFYGINILIYIIKYIFEIILDNKRVKKYKVVFYYLKQSHKARYSCLLQGDTKGAQEFEDLMKTCSDVILKVGPSIATYKTITKKERKEVQEIVNKTKVLLTTIQPPV